MREPSATPRRTNESTSPKSSRKKAVLLAVALCSVILGIVIWRLVPIVTLAGWFSAGGEIDRGRVYFLTKSLPLPDRDYFNPSIGLYSTCMESSQRMGEFRRLAAESHLSIAAYLATSHPQVADYISTAPQDLEDSEETLLLCDLDDDGLADPPYAIVAERAMSRSVEYVAGFNERMLRHISNNRARPGAPRDAGQPH